MNPILHLRWLHRIGLTCGAPWLNWTYPLLRHYYSPIMPSDRIQRTIDSLLDEVEQAVSRSDWAVAQDRARNVLALDPDNQDAAAFMAAADRAKAMSLLDESLAISSGLGMQPLVERVLSRREILGA